MDKKMKENLKTWLKETLDFYQVKGNESTTSWFTLEKADGMVMAIVAGFPEGLEDEEREPYMKFAIQPKNSIMQEYDMDWEMPVDPATGEVDDSEIPLSDDDEDIDWLMSSYGRYKETLVAKAS